MTIPEVTVLRVQQVPGEDGRITSIYVFEHILTMEDLEGRCLKADVLLLPQNDAYSTETGPMIAMEWCIHEKNGKAIKCSPGWSEHEEPRQYIKLKPPQV